MRRVLSVSLRVFSVGIFMLLFGCMAMRGPQFTDLRKVYWEKTASMPKSDIDVLLMVNATHYANGNPSPNAATTAAYVKAFDEALANQQLFRAIGTTVTEPDWSVTVDIREEEKFSEIGAMFCGATLCLIPVVAHVEMTASATVYDKSGNELTKLTSAQDLKIVYQLLFLLPWRMGLVQEAQQNLAKDMILKLAEFAGKHHGKVQ